MIMFLVRQKCCEGTSFESNNDQNKVKKQIFKKSNRRKQKALYAKTKSLYVALEKN